MCLAVSNFADTEEHISKTSPWTLRVGSVTNGVASFTATAFLIKERSARLARHYVFLTCWHVLEPMLGSQVPGVFLQFADPLLFAKGTHYTRYPGEDLAALFVSNESISFMSGAGFDIGNAWGVSVGALTVGWGFAQNWPYMRPMALDGMISDKSSLQKFDGNRSNHISVNFDNHYGCSGGPVMLSNRIQHLS